MKYRLINKQTNEEHLCDKVTIDGFDYYVNDFISDEVNGDLTKIPFEKLILIAVASNNPNIDIPKVVDEVDILAYEHDVNTFLSSDFDYDSFKAGYNKSQETHPFSEEDMIEFADWKDKNIQELNYSMLHNTKELLQLWKEQKTKTIYYE